MFVAVSDYEIPLMTALGGSGEKYFRAMELSVRLPWFLATALITAPRAVGLVFIVSGSAPRILAFVFIGHNLFTFCVLKPDGL